MTGPPYPLPGTGPPGPARQDRPSSRRILSAAALLFLLSLSAALLFLFSYPLPEVKNDAAEYLVLARNVAAGAGFSYDGETPAMYRPPLFSGLLGAWFSATGRSSLLSVAIFQSVVHSLGVVAAFLLFLEILPSLQWAAGAALFLAVNPLLVTRVTVVLQEPTLLLFTTVAIAASVRLVNVSGTGRAGLAGLAWGVCTLGKIVCGFAPFLLLSMRLLPARLRWSWRGRDGAILLLCFAAAVVPWTARNYLHFHRFIPVGGQGEGLLEWSVSHATIPGEQPGEAYVAQVYGKGLPEGERKTLLWKYVMDHPRYFLVDRVVRNAVRFAAPARDWWILRGIVRPGEHRTGFWILAALFHMPFYLFLLYRTWQWRTGVLSISVGFIVLFYWVYWAEHALLWGDPRYGLAVYPVLVSMVLPRES